MADVILYLKTATGLINHIFCLLVNQSMHFTCTKPWACTPHLTISRAIHILANVSVLVMENILLELSSLPILMEIISLMFSMTGSIPIKEPWAIPIQK